MRGGRGVVLRYGGRPVVGVDGGRWLCCGLMGQLVLGWEGGRAYGDGGRVAFVEKDVGVDRWMVGGFGSAYVGGLYGESWVGYRYAGRVR